MRTELCDLLGIRYPIIQGGMVWVSYSKLAAAVSNAGGLGLLASGSMTSEELRREIKETKKMTDAPFGVNVPVHYPSSEAGVQVCLEEGVRVVVTSAGNPARFTPMLKERGIKVLHVSPSVKLASKAEGAGVDAVIAEGYEAGGHNGFDEITTMALIPQVVDAVKVPVVAAGGIADGRGAAAAFALGAKGIQMGTRFIATHEAAVHPKYKETIVNASDTSTTITGRTIGLVRGIKNNLTKRIQEAEARGASPQEILDMIGSGRAERAAVKGDMEEGSIQAGQIAGLVKGIVSAADVIREMVEGYQRVKMSLP